jgi:hypothetical protein
MYQLFCLFHFPVHIKSNTTQIITSFLSQDTFLIPCSNNGYYFTEKSDSDDDFIGPQPQVEPLVRDETLRQDAPLREWDVGKKRKCLKQLVIRCPYHVIKLSQSCILQTRYRLRTDDIFLCDRALPSRTHDWNWFTHI